MINEHTAFPITTPFGGHKDSGMGTGGILYSIHDLYPEKLIVFTRTSRG